MRKLLVVAFAAVLCGWSSVAWAACPNGQVLKRIGSVLTASGAISTQGQDVQYIIADCSGTACTAGFYNGDALGDATDANLTAEIGGAANTTATLDLTNSPINFSSGVVFVDDGNVDAVAMFACQQR